MILVLKPFGRGSWEPIILTLSGRGVDNLFYRVGQRYTLDGMAYRIAQIKM